MGGNFLIEVDSSCVITNSVVVVLLTVVGESTIGVGDFEIGVKPDSLSKIIIVLVELLCCQK